MSYPSAEGLAGPEIEIAESGTMLDSRGLVNSLFYIIFDFSHQFK
jgi:hypothetical protein